MKHRYIVKFALIAAVAVFVQNAFGQNHTFTQEFKPTSSNGYSFTGNISVSIGKVEAHGLDGYKSIQVLSNITNKSNVVYIYEGKRYTASDIAEIGAVGNSGLYEIGISYQNGPVKWVKGGSSIPYISISELGITLPKVIAITEKSGFENSAAYNKNVDEHNRTLQENSDALSRVISNIRVQIRNCTSGGSSQSIENAIRRKLEGNAQQQQQQQQTSTFNVSAAQQNYNSEMQKIRNAESNSNTSFETQKREMQRQNERQHQQNQQRQTELQRKQAESQRAESYQKAYQDAINQGANAWADIAGSELQRREAARIAREERKEEEAREEARIRKERIDPALAMLEPQQKRYKAAAVKAISENLESQFLKHYIYYSEQIENVKRTSYISNSIAKPAPVDFSEPEPELSAAVCYEAAVRKAKWAVMFAKLPDEDEDENKKLSNFIYSNIGRKKAEDIVEELLDNDELFAKSPKFEDEIKNLLTIAKTFPDYDYDKKEAAMKAIDDIYLPEMKNAAQKGDVATMEKMYGRYIIVIGEDKDRNNNEIVQIYFEGLYNKAVDLMNREGGLHQEQKTLTEAKNILYRAKQYADVQQLNLITDKLNEIDNKLSYIYRALEDKMIVGYEGDTQAPFGGTIGWINDGFGFYISLRGGESVNFSLGLTASIKYPIFLYSGLFYGAIDKGNYDFETEFGLDYGLIYHLPHVPFYLKAGGRSDFLHIFDTFLTFGAGFAFGMD
ncbi:MAG: hypothetical protein LBC64_01110 [Fibromonadaceae bacterium]|jgi:hypothetical protein|nr:hypothetical protein [Fibromonadaceae bacterium]